MACCGIQGHTEANKSPSASIHNFILVCIRRHDRPPAWRGDTNSACQQDPHGPNHRHLSHQSRQTRISPQQPRGSRDVGSARPRELIRPHEITGVRPDFDPWWGILQVWRPTPTGPGDVGPVAQASTAAQLGHPWRLVLVSATGCLGSSWALTHGCVDAPIGLPWCRDPAAGLDRTPAIRVREIFIRWLKLAQCAVSGLNN